MTPRPYKPRRASKRWLEEAPEYILDVFDNKGKTADRRSVGCAPNLKGEVK